MKPGDLIWQSRMPGGICIFIEEVTIETTEHYTLNGLEMDKPVYRILHPAEGMIEDPSYYYMTLEEEEKYSRRRVAYELKKAGREVPDWLQNIVKHEEKN
jgi:hypothetical protein